MANNMASSPSELPLWLTANQFKVARLFFTLPSSSGFLLVGGAALLAHQLTDRPTRDLDFFTAPHLGNVLTAQKELAEAAVENGWTVESLHADMTFSRLLINVSNEKVLVDFAVDSAPEQPSAITIVGPTLAPEELAGRKTIALFDRAEARDFVDVYLLTQKFSKAMLLAYAQKIDRGFSNEVFIEMLALLAQFQDDEIPFPEAQVHMLREFFSSWRTELITGLEFENSGAIN